LYSIRMMKSELLSRGKNELEDLKHNCGPAGANNSCFQDDLSVYKLMELL